MSTSDHHRLNELWTRAVDDDASLTAEEQTELIAALKLEPALQERLLLDRSLHGQLRQFANVQENDAEFITRFEKSLAEDLDSERFVRAVDRRLRARSGPRARLSHGSWRRRLTYGIVSLAAAAAIAIIWFRPVQQRDLPGIIRVHGTVLIESRGGRTRAEIGHRLQPSDLIVTGETGLDLRYADGTTINVERDTRLAMAGDGADKFLRLISGSIEAEVAPQRPGRPMILSTAIADAVVVGTHFKLAALKDLTRLEVTKGTVRLTNSERNSVDVEAGHFAVASADAELIAHALPSVSSDVTNARNGFTQSVSDCLVGYWPFDDENSTGSRDLSGNGHDATLMGSPMRAAGKRNRALILDGVDDYADIPSLWGANFPASGTLAFWINIDFSTTYDACIFDYWGVDNNIFVTTVPDNRTINIGFLKSPSERIFNYGRPLSEHEWFHFAIVWDSTNGIGQVYRNGLLEETQTFSGAPWAPNGQHVQFGGDADSKWQFKGLLDEIVLCNQPLPAAAINQLYEKQ